MTQTQIRSIGLMSPGDMGQAVAVRLKELGFEVRTALAGRSERTRALAAQAGLADCGGLRELLAESDLLLSILDPGSAMTLAREVAALLPARPARGQPLSIHGWLYGLRDGRIRHLDFSVSGAVNLSELRERSVQQIIDNRARNAAAYKSAKK